MRKLFTLAAVVFTMTLFVNCTDNSLEELEQNERSRTKEHIKFDNIQLTDPEDDGEVENEELPGG